MGTRCQIIVEGNEAAKVYKHWDGYPDGVIPVLQELLPPFSDDRGEDSEYLVARIVDAFCSQQRRHRNDQITPCFTGYGVSNIWHDDIEYLYLITTDYQLVVYKPGQHPIDGKPETYGTEIMRFTLQQLRDKAPIPKED